MTLTDKAECNDWPLLIEEKCPFCKKWIDDTKIYCPECERPIKF